MNKIAKICMIGCMIFCIIGMIALISSQQSKNASNATQPVSSGTESGGAPTATQVSVEQLHSAYQQNEVLADSQYKGKQLLVTESAIENMTYVLGSEPIKFINGKARTDLDMYGIDKNSIVYGNLNGVAEPVAVLEMDDSGGGSAISKLLIAVWNANGTLMNSEGKYLGDRTIVNSISISSGTVTVDVLTDGPDDALCCPTQRKILRLALRGNQLVDVQ
jgi:hypothetical protein